MTHLGVFFLYERGQPSWLFGTQRSTSVAYMGKTTVYFLVERVFLFVHIAFVGVHSGNVNRGFFLVQTVFFLVHLGDGWYILGGFLISAGRFFGTGWVLFW